MAMGGASPCQGVWGWGDRGEVLWHFEPCQDVDWKALGTGWAGPSGVGGTPALSWPRSLSLHVSPWRAPQAES